MSELCKINITIWPQWMLSHKHSLCSDTPTRQCLILVWIQPQCKWSKQDAIGRLNWPISLPINFPATSEKEIGKEGSMLLMELHTLVPPWTDISVRWNINKYIKTKIKKLKVKSLVTITRLWGGVVFVCWSVSSTLFLSRCSRVCKTKSKWGVQITGNKH